MWPFRILETYKLSDSEIAAEWFESGELGALPDNEQRVYDVLSYLQDNYTSVYGSSLLDTYTLRNNDAYLRVSTICDSFTNDAVDARRFNTELSVVLQKPVKKAIIARMDAAVTIKEQAKVDAEWPLPTKWDKPKAKKKGK